MSRTSEIDFLLEEVVTLPSLPSTIAHLTELVDRPDCSLVAVGRAVSADPSIALKTLRLVNSAYYGLRNKVSSVDHAVVLLGIKVIKNLVLTATVFETLKKSGAGSILRHSVTCGAAMRLLVESRLARLPVDSPEEAFSYGLLHDIGKIIFKEFMPKESAKVVETGVAEGTAFWRVEREIIGADHAELGARLAQNWKLPEPLVGAIAGHHDLTLCPDPVSRELASLLAISDYICTACGLGSEHGESGEISEECWEVAGLSSRDIPPLLDKFFEALPSAQELAQLVA